MVIFLKYSELTCIVFCVLYMKPRARRWEVQGKVKRDKKATSAGASERD